MSTLHKTVMAMAARAAMLAGVATAHDVGPDRVKKIVLVHGGSWTDPAGRRLQDPEAGRVGCEHRPE
jgi:hypothetical protein